MKDGWIETFTGKRVYPLNMIVDDIDIRDIAHALSLISRYTGHCKFHYSVAQHSILCAQTLISIGDHELALMGLLHDAAEAYIGDFSRPLKRMIRSVTPVLEDAEDMLMAAITTKFDLPYPIIGERWNLIKEIDTAMLATEAKKLMPRGETWEELIGVQALPHVMILKYKPETVEKAFLAAYKAYAKREDSL